MCRTYFAFFTRGFDPGLSNAVRFAYLPASCLVANLPEVTRLLFFPVPSVAVTTYGMVTICQFKYKSLLVAHKANYVQRS